MSKEKKQRWYPGDLTVFDGGCRFYLYMYDSPLYPDFMLTHVYHIVPAVCTTADCCWHSMGRETGL